MPDARSPHSRLDGDDPRIEYISRAVDYVPLKLYDEIQRPAEEAVAELIHEHNGLLEQNETLLALLREITERPVNGLWSDQDLVDRTRAVLNPATEPGPSLREQLEAERRWKNDERRWKDEAREQLEALRGWIADEADAGLPLPKPIRAIVEGSNPASSLNAHDRAMTSREQLQRSQIERQPNPASSPTPEWSEVEFRRNAEAIKAADASIQDSDPASVPENEA